MADQSLQKEYVAGGTDIIRAALASIRAVMPTYVDDITYSQGIDIYDRMLRDTDVKSAFETWRLAVTSEGLSVLPAFAMPVMPEAADPQDIADGELALEYCEFIQRTIDQAEYSFHDSVKGLLDGAAYGSKCAEIVLEFGTAEDASRLVLKAVKPRPSKNFVYVVDEHANLLGVRPVTNSPGLGASPLSPEAMKEVLPASKFLIYTNDPADCDVRGRSLLRSAYTPWFLKTQVLPEFFKYLKAFATPSVIGKTSPTDPMLVPASDPATGEQMISSTGEQQMISAEKRLLTSLIAWANAYALAVPAGTEVDLLWSSGDGAAFRHALDWFGRQINEAILGTAQATREAQHESRSSKDVGQDVLGLRVADARIRMDQLLTKLVRLLIEVNFGVAGLAHAPKITLAKAEQQDKAALLDSYSKAFVAGFIHHSQLPALHAELGLPSADYEMMALEREEAASARERAAEESRRIFEPDADETDSDED